MTSTQEQAIDIINDIKLHPDANKKVSCTLVSRLLHPTARSVLLFKSHLLLIFATMY
jgi:hypothetical protein